MCDQLRVLLPNPLWPCVTAQKSHLPCTFISVHRRLLSPSIPILICHLLLVQFGNTAMTPTPLSNGRWCFDWRSLASGSAFVGTARAWENEQVFHYRVSRPFPVQGLSLQRTGLRSVVAGHSPPTFSVAISSFRRARIFISSSKCTCT